MARKKLIDYLNDPNNLKSISTEELRDWARTAPYAGLIHKLLVQKLILEKAPEKDLEEATTMAILNNANPGITLKSIEDFKQWMLSSQKMKDDKTEIMEDPEPSKAHGITDEDIKDQTSPIMESGLEDPISAAKVILPKDESADVQQEQLTTVPEETGDELSDFTSWLQSLKPVKDAETKGMKKLELTDSSIASSALAEILTEQGHIAEAIQMYELLILKNPEKSSFFAAQIEKLKAL